MSLLRELRENDPNDFHNYLRMDDKTFRHLLSMLQVHLKKDDTIMQESIPPEERLAATLRFLATDENLNFVFVGDEAFALHNYILKPYSQKELTHDKRVFNYRLSRCRNVVENTFGFIASVFRILHTKISVSPQNINYIVLAICILHNNLKETASAYTVTSTFDKEDNRTCEVTEGDWRNENSNYLTPLRGIRTTNTPLEAKNNREAYLKFFKENGQVEWQDEMIERGKG
ncbi:hypothetical protein NQ314_017120 [Rhamnusium bicolor]|uniref:DDE Tnp4 domain-containing protein n=1 Tax=Rhamnusium bicolor TaxID=1586634 RepID=A0AAV8WUJ5_9CUCU|nr:hypothetical protein NQ314_017120 [Rhamnusium bicolor]